MYESYFGLTQKPFNITPDPRFLYLSEQHRDALAHLLYSADESSSFILLTGEVGTGKTTLCRSLLEESIEGSQFALILNPRQTPDELLASIADEFGLNQPARFDLWNSPQQIQRKNLIDQLNQFLLEKHARGEQAIVVIDEAQNLTPETLEQVRLLTNLETGTQKLLKIILIGQPELRSLLNQPELRQLNQRVTARYHLEPLSAEETAGYVAHRLKVAGNERMIFKPAAIKRLHRLSGGIPRRINLIADRALMGAYAQQFPVIGAPMISTSTKEVSGEQPRPMWRAKPVANAALPVMLLLGALLWVITSATNNEVIENQPGTKAIAAQQYTAAIEDDMETRPPSHREAFARSVTRNELMTSVEQTDLKDALNTLIDLWKIPVTLTDANHACDAIAAFGLRCFYDDGGIESLQKLNHPAIIELLDDAQRTRQLAVIAHDNEQLRVRVNNNDYLIDTQSLQPQMTGNFLIFWELPPGGSRIIQPGTESPDVQWLRIQLNRYEGIGDSATVDGTQFFDETLAQRLIRFQELNGLKADGIAGEETFIALAGKLKNGRQPQLSVQSLGR